MDENTGSEGAREEGGEQGTDCHRLASRVALDGLPTSDTGVRSTPVSEVGLAGGSPLDLGMVSCIHRQ